MTTRHKALRLTLGFLLIVQLGFECLQNLDRIGEILRAGYSVSPVRMAYGDFQDPKGRINAVVFAPVLETLVFQTLIQNLVWLRRPARRWGPVVATALFVGYHVLGTGSLADALAIGAFVALVGSALALLFEAWGRGVKASLVVMVVHALSNAFQITFAVLLSGQGWGYWTAPWIEVRVVP